MVAGPMVQALEAQGFGLGAKPVQKKSLGRKGADRVGSVRQEFLLPNGRDGVGGGSSIDKTQMRLPPESTNHPKKRNKKRRGC